MCISIKNMSTLHGAIRTLRQRAESLHNLGFTHDEFLELFAPPEHWDVLKLASEYSNLNATGGAHWAMFYHAAFDGFSEASLAFAVNLVGERAPLRPRNTTVLHNNPELVARLVAWVNARVEVGYEFARAERLLDWLNDHCESLKQVRYLWPSLVALCALNDDTKDLADRLRDNRPPRALPSIPAEIRDACRSTAKAITLASLIHTDDVGGFTAPVIVGISRVDAMRREEHLGTYQPF